MDAMPLVYYIQKYWLFALLIWILIKYVFPIFQVDGGKLDSASAELLEGSSSVESRTPKECHSIANALESAERTYDMGTCAKQMSDIVRAKHLAYDTLIKNPETLLRVSMACAKANGALWTRFTVQYNLYAGSIVALGTDEQRAELCVAQSEGKLGCFAFTEKAAGVMSGAAMETTARYDATTKEFVIHSPTDSSAKNWISQGMYAEKAVILAELFIDEVSYGPHLFWSTIATTSTTKTRSKTGNDSGSLERPIPVAGVTIESLPEKTTLVSLDNASISFDNFRVPASALLSRFGGLEKNEYVPNLPEGCSRMLDLLISRLLTGRIVLSEATLSFALARLRINWSYCKDRKLWKSPRSKQPKHKTMAEMPLVREAFRDYACTLQIYATFIEDTRERVAQAIREQVFSHDLIEATCMCKFLGTGFGVDTVSAVRKVMGARGVQEDSGLGGEESFMPNATCAAEGDNTIMELKIVQDIVRGRTAKLPLALMLRICGDKRGRRAIYYYACGFARAMLLGKRAMEDGRLLRDIAQARAHMRVIDVWLTSAKGKTFKQGRWLESFENIAMCFPSRLQA